MNHSLPEPITELSTCICFARACNNLDRTSSFPSWRWMQSMIPSYYLKNFVDGD